ncbi:Esterase, SGNH hydrolase-type [Niveomyces insectorum RCEF 264]|uniref:Esterase, SGNH hydrolase-type n=1 Tax=Niveomyces insectorum RCEF 264 TaxID=1081102 RepID=A0A167P697_9HYPO|nr:Esterase, SGNH hydrolase-type [Niveomyces insectorum RCEF 264]
MRALLCLAVLSGAAASVPRRTTSRTENSVDTATTFTYLGRVNPAKNELTWPASGIAFTFTGTAAAVPITSLTGTNSVEVVVDGGPPTITNDLKGSRISIQGLAQGQHTVEIRKKSEALYGSIFIGTPTTPGTLVTPTSTRKKRIEIVGDSISVGYGMDAPYPCTNAAAVEDAGATYGALAAKNLSADYSIVAWSGKGLLRNYVTTSGADTSPLMPELWTRYGANDADNSYDFATPVDAVVINLGTNDFSYMASDASGKSYAARPPLNATAYTNGLVRFSRAVLAKYPDAALFITSSPMLSDTYPTADEAQHTKQETCIRNAVARIGAQAYFVSFPSQDQSNNNIGCDYHPSPLTHQKMAVVLTAALSSVLVS